MVLLLHCSHDSSQNASVAQSLAAGVEELARAECDRGIGGGADGDDADRKND